MTTTVVLLTDEDNDRAAHRLLIYPTLLHIMSTALHLKKHT